MVLHTHCVSKLISMREMHNLYTNDFRTKMGLRFFYCTLFCLFWISIGLPVAANSPSEDHKQGAKDQEEALDEHQLELKRKHKKMIRDMENLLRVAQEVGFTEEELKKITVQQEGEVINVWEFLQKENESQSAQKDEDLPQKKQYLTVQDITKELNKREKKQINTLKQTLMFSGKE